MNEVEDFLARQGEVVEKLVTIAKARLENDAMLDCFYADERGHAIRDKVLLERAADAVADYELKQKRLKKMDRFIRDWLNDADAELDSL